MQDLCAICTDFIISELWTSNFLAYQVQDAHAASFYYLIQPYAISLFELLTLLTCNSGFCREPRLWHTWRAGEKCLLGLPLSKWCHGVERGIK